MATMHDMHQYLTFTLGEELFALNIASVREILEMPQLTKLPRTASHMRGVINLRGHALPVVDVKEKFGMGQTDRTVNTCVIITEVHGPRHNATVGALADSVQEVVELDPAEIDEAPAMGFGGGSGDGFGDGSGVGEGIDPSFIKGLARSGDRFIILLDVDRVFSGEELSGMQAMTGAA